MDYFNGKVPEFRNHIHEYSRMKIHRLKTNLLSSLFHAIEIWRQRDKSIYIRSWNAGGGEESTSLTNLANPPFPVAILLSANRVENEKQIINKNLSNNNGIQEPQIFLKIPLQ